MRSMQTVHTVDALRAIVRDFRRDGESIGFVPTMGNLHAGHFSLIDLARKHADRVIASVFVNPTQFGPTEDFARYPRTLDSDSAGLSDAGCDLLFAPDVQQMYPDGIERAVDVHIPGMLTEVLDGAHRPGHFDGVATVVTRLFNMVQPDVAVFGQKDYQQLQVIRALVRDLAFPVEIIAAPIARAEDGLALSSRNQYLSDSKRAIAPEIHRTLLAMNAAVNTSQTLESIKATAAARLAAAGFSVDYVAIHRDDLSESNNDERVGLVGLIAARLGDTRLIDNMVFDQVCLK